MKSRSISMTALIAALVVMLVSVPVYASEITSTSTATVSFIEGALEMVDPDPDSGLNGMDIDFGSNDLPAGAVSIAAADGDHTLTVADARTTAGDWTMNVELSAFTTADSVTPQSFDASIEFVTPTADPDAEISVEEGIEVMSGGGQVLVETASDQLERGTYNTTWLQADILLNIDGTEYENVQVADYEAEFTWTLIVG